MQQMDEHLGYVKNQKSTSSNSRNGKSSKRVKTEDGEFELDTPRDRDGSSAPHLIWPIPTPMQKQQTTRLIQIGG